MKLTDIQKQILGADARFKVVVAGRRGGKTYCSIASLAKHARIPNTKCLYVAPSYRMAKQIVWQDLKDLLREVRWLKRINESELTVTLVNNSIIMLRSADNPDSIRGIGVDHCIIDEAADIDEEAWTAVIRPTLSDREGSALIIGTPKGRNWFYDLYNNAKHTPDWFSLQFSTAQGGNVSETELAQARADLDERTYRQEYEAQFVDYSGVIYYAFGEHNIVDMPITTDTRTPLHIGMDFNVDPGSAVIGFEHKHGIHIFDELEIFGTDTGEMCREIQQRYPNRRVFAYPDASGAQRRTSSGGITDHVILKNHGFDLRVGSVNPSVKDRIAAVNSTLKKENMRLTVSPKCAKLINAFRKHTYKEGTRQPDKNSGLDHLLDSCGYLINHLYPLKVNTQPVRGHIRRATGHI